MKRLLPLIAFLLCLASARAATITFTFTNSLGNADTNAVIIYPISSPVRADGGYHITGVPVKVRPNSDGMGSVRLMEGNYVATNAFLGQGIIFDSDNSLNTYSLYDREISGGNVFVTRYVNTNSQTLASNVLQIAAGTGTQVESNSLLRVISVNTNEIVTRAFLTNTVPGIPVAHATTADSASNATNLNGLAASAYARKTNTTLVAATLQAGIARGGLGLSAPVLSVIATNDVNAAQGSAYGNGMRFWCDATAFATGNFTSNYTSRINTWDGFNHFGDFDYYGGYLYAPMQYYAGCGNSSNAAIAVFTANTAFTPVNFMWVSNRFTEISAVTIDSVNAKLYGASFCDLSRGYSQIEEYAISGVTNLTWVRSIRLSKLVASIQGAQYLDGVIYLSGGEGRTEIWGVDPDTGDARLLLTRPVVNEIEGLATTNGLLEFIDQDAVMIQVSNTNYAKLSGVGKYPFAGTSQLSQSFGLSDGLLVYYPFTDDRDKSVNNNDASISTNIFTADGVLGNGIHLDGTNWVTCTNRYIGRGLTAITVAGWFRKTNSSLSTLAQKHGGGTDGEWFLSMPSNTSVRWTTINDVANRTEVSATVPALNDSLWHHLAGTYDGATMRLWFDGECVATAAQTNALKKTSYYMLVGDQPAWAGYIDEFYLYGRALRTNEIKLLYRRAGGE